MGLSGWTAEEALAGTAARARARHRSAPTFQRPRTAANDAVGPA